MRDTRPCRGRLGAGRDRRANLGDTLHEARPGVALRTVGAMAVVCGPHDPDGHGRRESPPGTLARIPLPRHNCAARVVVVRELRRRTVGGGPSRARRRRAAGEDDKTGVTDPCSGSECVARGNVKWFNDAKGVGFIADEEGREVFVHYSSIRGEGFRTLAEGEPVEFDLVDGPKGPQASNVRRG